MAASITIARNLNDQYGTENAPLVSAFTTNSIEFDFDREANTGTYAKVEIDGVSFFATKLYQYGATSDRYIIDLTNILPSFLDINLVEYPAVGSLAKTINIDIFGYSSAGILLASNTTHPDVDLCFGYPKIGVSGGLDELWKYGRTTSTTIYSNGYVCIYNSGTAGVKTFTMDGGLTYQLQSIAAKFTLFPLIGNLRKSGTLTGSGDLSVKVVYRPAKITDVPVWWIDRDGCWSTWYFRLLSTNNDVQRSKEVPIYAYTNATQKGRTREIGAAKSIDFLFDTLAVNAEHYKILTEIKESPLVVYDGRIVKVADSSSETAECKQNLRFTITLKMQENVVSY